MTIIQFAITVFFLRFSNFDFFPKIVEIYRLPKPMLIFSILAKENAVGGSRVYGSGSRCCHPYLLNLNTVIDHSSYITGQGCTQPIHLRGFPAEWRGFYVNPSGFLVNLRGFQPGMLAQIRRFDV